MLARRTVWRQIPVELPRCHQRGHHPQHPKTADSMRLGFRRWGRWAEQRLWSIRLRGAVSLGACPCSGTPFFSQSRSKEFQPYYRFNQFVDLPGEFRTHDVRPLPFDTFENLVGIPSIV